MKKEYEPQRTTIVAILTLLTLKTIALMIHVQSGQGESIGKGEYEIVREVRQGLKSAGTSILNSTTETKNDLKRWWESEE